MSASLGTILADGGFEGEEWQEKIYQQFGLEVEVVKRSDEAEGFELLPQRWIVERSFGWMNYYQPLEQRLRRPCQAQSVVDAVGHDRQDTPRWLEPDW